MDDLAGIIDQVLTEGGGFETSAIERRARVVVLGLLFQLFGVEDSARFDLYLAATTEIPLDKLQLAVKATVRGHPWPSLPQVAELWEAARLAAGMHRQQYRHGCYLPAPREWPPPGQRYATVVGELEAAPILQLEGPESLRLVADVAGPS